MYTYVCIQLTYADLILFDIWDRLVQMPGIDAAPLLDACKHIQTHREKIGGLPAIKEWMEKRPKTFL